MDINMYCQTDGGAGYDETHRHPQHEFVYSNGERQCEVFKYEDGLESIIEKVAENIRLNIKRFCPKMMTYPYHNKLTISHRVERPRVPYYELLNAESIDAINKRYALDFEKFGYEYHK
jgi:hypothetical protein